MVNFSSFKKEIKELYKQHNISEKSELEGLFCHVLNCNTAKLLTLENIPYFKARKIRKKAKNRILGMPLCKIIKQAPFYGETFYVNKNVLTPRKETELLVEEVLKDNNKPNLKVLDLGTGSGVIAIVLAKKLNSPVVTASDISSKVLKVAKRNAKQKQAKIRFVKSNLFDRIKDSYDIIISNPPYIKKEDINSLAKEVKKYDPKLALDGGVTGYRFYKQIIRNASAHLAPGGKIYLELGINQSEYVKQILSKNFENIKIIKDYSGIDRIIKASKKL